MSRTTTLLGKAYPGRPMMNSWAWFLLCKEQAEGTEAAQKSLDALNRMYRVAQHPEIDLASQFTTVPLEGLVTVPAVTLVEVEHLGPGRIAA